MFRIGIGWRDAAGMQRRWLAQQVLIGRGQPRIDAADREAIRLVGAVQRMVGRGFRQCPQIVGSADQQAGDRQLRTERMQLRQIKIERARRLHAQRLFQHLGSHKRVAVAVAADPAAHLHEAGQLQLLELTVLAAQQILEPGIQVRQLAQEGVVVEAEAVLDLVQHRQLGGAQHTRLPQRQYRALQGLLVGFGLFRRQLHAVALVPDRRHGVAREHGTSPPRCRRMADAPAGEDGAARRLSRIGSGLVR